MAETWAPGFALVTKLETQLFPLGEGGCHDVRRQLWRPCAVFWAKHGTSLGDKSAK